MTPAMMAYYQMATQAQQMMGQPQQQPISQQRFAQMMRGQQIPLQNSPGIPPNPVPGEASESPLQRGISTGRSAARESLAMDENERQRAIGMAMMQFGASMGQPGYGEGFGGTLNAINQSILPAIQAYQQEEARNAEIKAYMQQQEAKALHEQLKVMQEEQKQLALQKHREAIKGFQERKLEGQEKYQKGQLELGRTKIRSAEQKEAKRLSQNQKQHEEKMAQAAKKIEASKNYYEKLVNKWSLELEQTRERMIQNQMKNLSEFDPDFETKRKSIEENVDKRLAPYYEDIKQNKVQPTEFPSSSMIEEVEPEEEYAMGGYVDADLENLSDEELLRIING